MLRSNVSARNTTANIASSVFDMIFDVSCFLSAREDELETEPIVQGWRHSKTSFQKPFTVQLNSFRNRCALVSQPLRSESPKKSFERDPKKTADKFHRLFSHVTQLIQQLS